MANGTLLLWTITIPRARLSHPRLGKRTRKRTERKKSVGKNKNGRIFYTYIYIFFYHNCAARQCNMFTLYGVLRVRLRCCRQMQARVPHTAKHLEKVITQTSEVQSTTFS